jgi:hypothetical protein
MQLYLQHLVFVTPLLLPAAVVEEWKSSNSEQSSNSPTIAADNSTGTYIIRYSIERIAFSAQDTLFNNCNFNPVYRYSLSVNLTLSIAV